MGLAQEARELATALAAEVEQTSTRQQYIRAVSLAQQAARLAGQLEVAAETDTV
jgi:hypothetical protein